jgi:hypothetical protein
MPKLTHRQVSRHIESIQTAKHIKQLQDHAFDVTEMSESRIRVSLAMLKKTMGDQQAIEVDMQGDMSLNVNILGHAE